MLTALKRYWWLPLAVLALLIVKTFLVTAMIVAEARDRAALAANIPPERVEIFDGLDVRLTDFSSQAELDAAVAAVDALDWSGEVEGLLGISATVNGGAATTTTEATAGDDDQAESAPASPDATTMAVALSAMGDGGVMLEGTVPSDDVRAAMVDAAAAAFGADAVIDELVVDESAVAPEGGTVVVSGEATTDVQQGDWLAAAEAVAGAAGLEVVDETSVVTIEQQLNEIFGLDPIEFDTASARIRPESEPTLDRAAAILTANPDAGRLLVVGHTDTAGEAAANQRLSQRRAEAVVDYLVSTGGVDPGRLDAEGRGEQEPKVTPEESPEDRQRNRRIEWELIDP